MKASKEIQRMILEVVNAENYKPIKPAGIAAKLKLKNADDVREVKRAVKVLIKGGKLTYGSKHQVLPGKPLSGKKKQGKPSGGKKYEGKKAGGVEVVGVYRRNPSGFGFVTPQNSIATDRSDDIYVGKSDSSDAANGDTVRLVVTKRKVGRESKTSGKVIDVVERRTNRFVGTYVERGGYGFVTIDNGTFESAILVGDASARNCRVEDKVVIEMAKFPSKTREGEGVVVEVLGERGAPGVDTQMIIHEYGLPGEFPESVLKDARKQADAFDEKIKDGRVNFTKTTVVTIDPKTARDFDDAISLERLKNGHWKLGVHIADVSHFVPERSKVDNEAFKRATSIYLPDRVIPMLPELISNNLASLQPDRVRYTMTALIEFTEDGAPVATELHRGAIKSAHRFNYEEIDEYLEDDRPWKKKLKPDVFRIVREMHTLAMMLRKRRKARGSIDLSLPDVRIDLDEDGRVSGAHAEVHTESHQMIEEFMLAANEAVAQRMVDEKLFLMRRIHEAPSEAKLKDLTKFVRHLGIDCGNLQDRFEIKRVVDESADMPQKHAIHFSILRSMQKALYSPQEYGHYALASEAYCHFTSPIRRYPDLIIHRVVGQMIDGKKPFNDFEKLASLGRHCSDLERRAEQAERELIKLKLINFLVDKVGTRMQAVITGVESFGVFAQGIELPAEGLIPLASLPADRYHYDKSAKELSGHRPGNLFRLGDKIEIKITKADSDNRELEFEYVVPERTPNKRKTRKKVHKNDQKKPKKWIVKGERSKKKKKTGESRASRKKAAAKKAKKAARKANKKSANKKSASKKSKNKSSAKKSKSKKSASKKSGKTKSSKKKNARNKKGGNKKSGKKKGGKKKKSGKKKGGKKR